MGLAILVNPDLVLIGGEPTAIRLDGLAVDVEGGWGGRVVYLDVHMVLSTGDKEGVGHAKLQVSVNLQAELSFGYDAHLLGVRQADGLRELHRRPVGILLPEWGKHRTTLGAAVVETVSQPYLKVAGIPYPCGLLLVHEALSFFVAFSGVSPIG